MTVKMVLSELDNYLAYCKNCTTQQLENILEAETRRAEEFSDGNAIRELALILAHAAKYELGRRDSIPLIRAR